MIVTFAHRVGKNAKVGGKFLQPDLEPASNNFVQEPVFLQVYAALSYTVNFPNWCTRLYMRCSCNIQVYSIAWGKISQFFSLFFQRVFFSHTQVMNKNSFTFHKAYAYH